ncbi:MAG TPA: ATP-dependent 6-phosphofructokinase [Thermoanaerobaculia bacterium]|nr:ATP-dependent 6-phosphofructokinase [Thermoanaerobaculia bacterium]
MSVRRIGVLTGGGDAPGLNAVLRAVVRAAERLGGMETVGIRDGFQGLLEKRYQPLSSSEVRDLTRKGGTILGTTNRTNPFAIVEADGSRVDRSARLIENAREAGLDAVVVIGGDGSLKIALELWKLGLPVVGVPKTIDNDLAATDFTFGFWTAIETATEALDRLRDTGESHHRVMLLEVMGRDAGWIALVAGISGGADVILIPEIPYSIRAVEAKVEERAARGQAFSLVVVAEGARADGGEPSFQVSDAGDGHPRHGGAAERLAAELKPHIEHEIRWTVLGHLQRGGSPVSYDRVLSTRLGCRAAELAAQERFGRMACLREGRIHDVPIADAVDRLKRVDPEGNLVTTARMVGVGFGDEI